MLHIDPPFVSSIVAIAAAVVATFSYLLNRKLQPLAPAAKLMDRLYELDKLILQYPEVMAVFMQQTKRTDAFFYAPETVVPRDAMYFRLKAFTYFWMNFVEEVFLALQDKAVSDQIEGEGWLDYIVQKMRHPLLREVFDREADRIYKGKFADYIRSKSAEINQPCDSATW